MTRGGPLVLALLLLLAFKTGAETPPRIAIIIDDLGYHLGAGKRAIALPGPITFAVLPGTPRGKQLAKLAHASGKEVLLHLPMEPLNYRGPAEPGGIMLDMSREAFRATFAGAIDTVPHAIGVSNHRGSLLTQHPGHMEWLMQEIRQREDLFFIDSYTTHHSIALDLAVEQGIPAERRDVFLDHERTVEAVAAELERLKAKARREGHAIAIGHPVPETLEVLERELPRLKEQGFELVTISELVHPEWNRI